MTTAQLFLTTAAFALTACAQPESAARRITFNGEPVTSRQQRTLELLEMRYAA